MNSVALPASATTAALGAETDLVRRAARGDEESFGELYRRHGQVAWRFAQAVSVDRDDAVTSVAEGFGRALRTMRRHSKLESEGFRPVVLAAVYRAGVERVHSSAGPSRAMPAATAARSKSARAKAAELALVEAAFRSLPERWRAAVWLGDVESMPVDRIAPVLGVSTAVATQLLTRGQRGLAGRFTQAHRAVPDHLGTALRPLAVAVPASLGDEVAARWSALAHDPSARFAPLTGWLAERAVRPLWVSVGGLMGLSLIGLGIVGQDGGIANGPVASSLPAGVNAPGVNPPGPLTGSFGPVTPGSGLNPFALPTATDLAAFSTTFGSGGTGGTGSTYSGGSTPGGAGTGSGQGTTPPGNNPPPGPTPPTTIVAVTIPPPPPGTPTPPVTVLSSPVASVTQSGGTTSANVLPTSSGNAATVSLCGSSGVGITVGSTAYGCAPAGTSASSNTASPTSSVIKTITSTVSTLPGL